MQNQKYVFLAVKKPFIHLRKIKYGVFDRLSNAKIFEIAIFNDLMGKRSWKGGKMAYGVSEFHELIKSELNLKSREMQIQWITLNYINMLR